MVFSSYFSFSYTSFSLLTFSSHLMLSSPNIKCMYSFTRNHISLLEKNENADPDSPKSQFLKPPTFYRNIVTSVWLLPWQTKLLLLPWEDVSQVYSPLNVASVPLHLPRGAALGLNTKQCSFLWKPAEPCTPALRGGESPTDLQNWLSNEEKGNCIRKYLYDKFDLER